MCNDLDMSDNNQNTTPPGWYPQPNDPTTKRWWDGTQWTENTAPADTSAPSNATPWTSQAPAKSKAPLFIGLGVGALLLVVILVIVAVFAFGGKKDDNPVVTDPPTSSQSPDDEPSEEPSEEPTDEPSGYEEDPTSEITSIEKAYADATNDYFATLGLPGQDAQKIIDYGYAACYAVEGGMTKDEFYDYIVQDVTTQEEAQAMGFMFGAGVSSLCPEYTSTVTGWI